MAKKMGTNPLSGLNSLIRDTHDNSAAHSAQPVQEVHNIQLVPHIQHDSAVQDAPDTQAIHDVQPTQDDPYAHGAQPTQDVQPTRANIGYAQGDLSIKTQGRKGQKLPRINMAFYPDNLAYLQAIAGFERMSATQYVNNLIKQDQLKRQALYDQLLALRGD